MKWRCYNRYLWFEIDEICHHQMRFMGSSTSKIRPDPAGGAYSAPPDLAGGKKPFPALGPPGLALRPFGPQA